MPALSSNQKGDYKATPVVGQDGKSIYISASSSVLWASGILCSMPMNRNNQTIRQSQLSRKELPWLFFDTGHIPSFCQSSLRINPEEVAEVFTVQLSVLCDPKNHGYTQVRTCVKNIYDPHNNYSISLEYLVVLATPCQSFEEEPTQFGDSLPLLHYR